MAVGAAQVLVIIESRQLALVQMNQTIDYSFIDTPVSQLRANMSQVIPSPSQGAPPIAFPVRGCIARIYILLDLHTQCIYYQTSQQL